MSDPGENSMIVGAEEEYDQGRYNGSICDENESDNDYLENQDDY